MKQLGVLGLLIFAIGAVGPSPVADAAMKGDLAAVRALVAKGANVNAPQGDGMTALHWAAERADSRGPPRASATTPRSTLPPGPATPP
jgi:ankyrin repeat protein